MGHGQPPPIESANNPPEKSEDKLARKANDNLQGDVSKQGFEGLNTQVNQQNLQEKVDRKLTLDEQLQKNGTAKMGIITRDFNCSVEISGTDPKTGKAIEYVRGRSREEVARAKQAESQNSQLDQVQAYKNKFGEDADRPVGQAKLQQQQGNPVLLAYGNDTASDASPTEAQVYYDAQQHEKIPGVGWTPLQDSQQNKDDALAWDPKQIYDNVKRQGQRTDIVRMSAGPDVEHKIWPYRGMEHSLLDECTKQDPKAWEHAYSEFPSLRNNLSEAQAVQLMKAIVHNELHNYSFEDAGQDRKAKHGLMDSTSKETIGYAQISPRAIKEFETGVTASGVKVREPYPQLSEFFHTKGYSEAGYQSRVSEDPTCIPMIVAAKLESLCDYYKSHKDVVSGSKTDITPQSLAYGFNADVFYDPHNKTNPGFHANPLPVVASAIEEKLGNQKAFPTSDRRALQASLHLQNVQRSMDSLR